MTLISTQNGSAAESPIPNWIPEAFVSFHRLLKCPAVLGAVRLMEISTIWPGGTLTGTFTDGVVPMASPPAQTRV